MDVWPHYDAAECHLQLSGAVRMLSAAQSFENTRFYMHIVACHNCGIWSRSRDANKTAANLWNNLKIVERPSAAAAAHNEFLATTGRGPGFRPALGRLAVSAC